METNQDLLLVGRVGLCLKHIWGTRDKQISSFIHYLWQACHFFNKQIYFLEEAKAHLILFQNYKKKVLALYSKYKFCGNKNTSEDNLSFKFKL